MFYLERLKKCPEEYSDGVAASKKFDESRRSKQAKHAGVNSNTNDVITLWNK